MATITSRRVCRTCPAVISGLGASDQCRPCQQRSEAVRAAFTSDPPPPVPAAARKHDCATDGHHACKHYVVMLAYVLKILAECGFCPICGVDPEGGEELVHRPRCALLELIEVEKGRELL